MNDEDLDVEDLLSNLDVSLGQLVEELQWGQEDVAKEIFIRCVTHHESQMPDEALDGWAKYSLLAAKAFLKVLSGDEK